MSEDRNFQATLPISDEEHEISAFQDLSRTVFLAYSEELSSLDFVDYGDEDVYEEHDYKCSCGAELYSFVDAENHALAAHLQDKIMSAIREKFDDRFVIKLHFLSLNTNELIEGVAEKETEEKDNIKFEYYPDEEETVAQLDSGDLHEQST